MTRDLLAGLGVAASLVALAFLTSSSIDQTVTGPGTWSQIAVTFLGAGACAVAVLVSGPGRAWGAPAIALFAAFTAFAGASILWSAQPDWSWFGASQLLSYLSAFAGAVVLGRLVPGRWTVLAGGLVTGTAAICAYSLLAKVFPATLASANTYGRLLAPFRYWNATGLSAAMGLAPALWVATRRNAGVILRGLAVPAMTLMISVVVLSYSRSALLAAVVAVAAWLAFVPLRLRSALMLAASAACALPIVLIALHSHNLTGDDIAPGAQDAAGHAFGPVLLGLVVLAAVAGVAASAAMDRVTVREEIRRRTGTGLLAGVALVPVAAVVVLALSSRGLSGEISHAWHSLTSTNSVVLDNATRLTQLGSARPLYWREGLDVGAHALLKGAGELGYGVARLRYTTDTVKADQAHSYVIQTFADLGLVGIALTFALLAAWARAAARPLALRTPRRSLTDAQRAEREGLTALAIVVVAFGIQSCLDISFYFPGLTIPALLCAGWLAGRGPLAEPVGRRRGGRLSVLDRPGAGAAITGLAAVALIGGWLMWQPLRSAQAMIDAENHPDRAFVSARAAVSRDPFSLEPRYLLSSLYQAAGDARGARAELAKATQAQPENPRPWVLLGLLDFHNGRYANAISEMRRVLVLEHPSDVNTLNAGAVINQSRAVLAQRAAQRKGRPVSSRRQRRARAKHPGARRRTHR